MKLRTAKERYFFQRMLSRSAVSIASPYLHHEKSVLIEKLEDIKNIDNTVVVGAGPCVHMEPVLKRQKMYIGIDPYYPFRVSLYDRVLLFDCFFEHIDREQLPKGNFLFIFCFNVLFYINNPERYIGRILRKGDAIFISQWAHTDNAVSLMKEYFYYIYEGSEVRSRNAIENILRSNMSLTELKLNKIEKIENKVNTITFGYFEGGVI